MIKKKSIVIGLLLILLMTTTIAEEISVNFNLGNIQSIDISYNLGDIQTITVSADITASPITVGELQLCDGTCADTKSINPALEFTVKITATGGEGESIDTDAFDLYFYQSADTNNSSTDWDNIKLLSQTTAGHANGCVEAGTTYCLTVQASDWTEKFKAGTADIWVKAIDTAGDEAFIESLEALTVGETNGVLSDSSTATYDAMANTTQNAILTDQTNAYITLTSNANVPIDIDLNGYNFISGENTITKGNQKFNSENNYGEATAITGNTQEIKSALSVGTYPVSSTHNEWLWLNIPDQQPFGEYTSTLTFTSEAS